MTTKIKISPLFLAFIGLIGCRLGQIKYVPEIGLYKVSILYPSGAGKTFDFNYYEKTHMPLVAGFLGNNLKFYEIDKGVAGSAPDEEVPYVAIGSFYCYDFAEYNKAIAQHIDTILNDIKNYTNIQPVVQVSEIKQLRYSTKFPDR